MKATKEYCMPRDPNCEASNETTANGINSSSPIVSRAFPAGIFRYQNKITVPMMQNSTWTSRNQPGGNRLGNVLKRTSREKINLHKNLAENDPGRTSN